VLEFTSKLLAPFNATASWFGKRVLHLSRPREIFLAREDLKDVGNQIERLGMLSPMERQMIHNVVSFRSVRVRDVMVPIERVVSVPGDSSLDEVIQRSRELKFDRFPVENQAGEIIGLINVLDVILDRRPEVRARQFVRRILSLRADDPASTALRRLRASPQGLASVLDENRKVIGIVTLEDLLNPLVRVA
jgi:CBS domain containing-hemolysin-like protein